MLPSRIAEMRRFHSSTPEELELRRWPAPALPDHPYPVLLPYTHPGLMAGRERELAELRRVLARPEPIVGFFAPSGAGKSSLLGGGLAAGERAAGRPVAYERHVCEAGLAGRLLGDLLAGDEPDLADEDPGAFVDRLIAVRRAAGAPAILVLDQFEDLWRHAGARRARAVAGLLLAASVKRRPGLAEAPCRWILTYRQEFHGRVVRWLGDVLRDADAEGLDTAALPHDLSDPDRFRPWPLAPLGAPAPGSRDRAAEATRIFLAAITQPLSFYRLRFAPGLAERLAREPTPTGSTFSAATSTWREQRPRAGS